MKKSIFIFVIFLSVISYGQESNVSFELLKLIENVSERSRNTEYQDLHLIIKARTNLVHELEKNDLLLIKYSVNNIHAIKLRFNDLDKLLKIEGIEKVELHDVKILPHDVKALRQMHVDSVYNGLGTLQTNYTGKGVVFGMIDSGIDPSSPEFKNEDGSSRILSFWNQNDDTNTFDTYGYGKLYSQDEINNNALDDYRDTTYNGHGTAVASVAVGGGMIHDSVRGVAPEADIIAVGINPRMLDYTNRVPSMLAIVDAIHFIFNEAERLGKPAVINISLGGIEGSHDGQDLPTQMIEGLLEQKVGRALVVAAGNAGTVKHHIRFELDSDRKFSWFRPMVSNSSVCKRDSGMYMSFYMDSLDAESIEFKVSLELTEPCCTQFGDSEFRKIINTSNGFEIDTIYLENQEEAIIKTYTEKIGATYGLFVEVTTSVEDYLCRVSFEGNGIVDGWSGALDERSCNSEYVSTQYLIGNRDEIENFDNYVRRDQYQNIGTAYACSDKVITVGAYNVRTTFWDVDSTKRSYMLNPLEKASFSSVGPTRDGRIKPDILGPGSRIIATNANQVLEDKLQNSRSTVYLSGEHVITDGTSFASPAVAGVVALFFEKFPEAGYRDIKRVMTTTSIKDNEEYPNNESGYGRINAMGLLNYEGSVEINEIDKWAQLSVFPNPSNGMINLNFETIQSSKKKTVQIYNQLGQLIHTQATLSSSIKIILQLPGIYFAKVITQEGIELDRKFVVTPS